ncbi:peptidylprolyl isomerase [Thermospira aquatica]|uniref:Peptidylprolyl isomerase n=1 Tax=Thermospira aquatica TaxID=2828656 RepID=A0AAX3BAM9_9SPIR|nr:peptidylprolyl isomerase [Thermospira aquatica]URA09180.1 peptidylprolyl isomerase [Thermospira aquatica]
MNFKKWLLASITTVFVFSCSQPVLTYEIGGKKKSVTYNDVKDLVEYMATSYPQYLQDVEMLKNVLFSESRASKDIILFEELKAGLTNSPEFNDKFSSEIEKQYFIYLAQEGTNWVAQKTKNTAFPVVRASHILFTVNTNATKEEVRLLAQNTLDTLKKSKNFTKDFSNAAIQYSQDPGSKDIGGDLGYFLEGMMVPEFENAVFTTKKKGLLPELVETSDGYHIIYVTEPKTDKSYSWIEKQVQDGKMSYYVLMKLQQDLQTKTLAMAVKKNYTLEDNKVKVGKNEYEITAIPDNTVLFSVWGKNYTWKEVKNLFALFIPGYEQELSTQFDALMNAAQGFLVNVEGGRKIGKDNADSRRKVREDALIQYAMNNFEQILFQQASSMITDKDVKDFYEQNKARLVKDGKPMPFDENLKNQIRNQLIQSRMWYFYQSWLDQKKSEYKVTFNQNGLNDLLKKANKIRANAEIQGNSPQFQ